MARAPTNRLGVPNFEPAFYRLAEDVPPGLLTPVLGRRFTGSWVAWDERGDVWFDDAPVVLEFDGLQLELCHFKLDQLSITIGGIDLSQGLDLYGVPLEWRRDAHPILAAAVGRTVCRIRLVDYRFGLADFVGTSPWVLAGFEVVFGGGDCIAVNNGLDCNAIAAEASAGPDFRGLAVRPTG